MFSWVVKVVPQPPEPPAKLGEVEKCKEPAPKPAPAPAPKPTAAAAPAPKPTAAAAPAPKPTAAAAPAPKPTAAAAPAPKPAAAAAPAPKPAAAAAAADKKVTFKDAVKEEGPKATSQKPKEEATTMETGNQTGVLTWISHGLINVLPQPVGTPKLNGSNTEVKEENPVDTSKPEEEQGSGVVGWIVQGLGKVVPQPDGPKDSPEIEEATEIAEVRKDPECKRVASAPVYETKELPDAEPLPHIPVVEVVSESEVSDQDSRFPPRVIGWLKQGLEKMVPQPPESAVPVSTETPAKKEAPAPQKVASPPPEPPKPAEGEQKAQNVVGWIFQGLGRIIPQPSTKSKEDGECTTTMQNGGTTMRAP